MPNSIPKTVPPNPKQFLKRGERWQDVTSKISRPRLNIATNDDGTSQYDEEDIVKMYESKKNFNPVFESSEEIQSGDANGSGQTNANQNNNNQYYNEEDEVEEYDELNDVDDSNENDAEYNDLQFKPQKTFLSQVDSISNENSKPSLQRGYSGRMLTIDDLDTTTNQTEVDDDASFNESFNSVPPTSTLNHTDTQDQSQFQSQRMRDKPEITLEERQGNSKNVDLQRIDTTRSRLHKQNSDSNVYAPSSPIRSAISSESGNRSRTPTSRSQISQPSTLTHLDDLPQQENSEETQIGFPLQKPYLSHVSTTTLPSSASLASQRRPQSGRLIGSDSSNRPLLDSQNDRPSAIPTFGINVPIHSSIPTQSRSGSQAGTPGTPSMFARHFPFEPTPYTSSPYDTGFTKPPNPYDVHQQHFDFVPPYNNVPYPQHAPSSHIPQHAPSSHIPQHAPMHIYQRPPTFDPRLIPNHEMEYVDPYHPETFSQQPPHALTPTSRRKSTKQDVSGSESDDQEESLDSKKRKKFEKIEEKQKEEAKQIQEQMKNLKREKELFQKEKEKMDLDKKEFLKKREEHKRKIENKLSTIRKEKDALDNQKKEIENLKNRQQSIDAKELEVLREENEMLNNKLNEIEMKQKEEVEHYKINIDKERRENSSLNEKNKILNKKVLDLQQELIEKEETISKLRSEIEKLKQQNKTLNEIKTQSQYQTKSQVEQGRNIISNLPRNGSQGILSNQKLYSDNSSYDEEDEKDYDELDEDISMHEKIETKYANIHKKSNYIDRYSNEEESQIEDQDTYKNTYNYSNSRPKNIQLNRAVQPSDARNYVFKSDKYEYNNDEIYQDSYQNDENSLNNEDNEYNEENEENENEVDNNEYEDEIEYYNEDNYEDQQDHYEEDEDEEQNNYNYRNSQEQIPKQVESKIKSFIQDLLKKYSISIHEEDPEDKPSKLLKTIPLENGKYEEVYASKVRHVIYPNGTVKKMFPNGFSIVLFDNGDVKKTYPSEKVVYFYKSVNTTHISYPNKLEVFEFGNGQTEKHFPEGSKYIIFPDETKKYILSTGHEEIHFPDGTVQMTLSNGEKSVRFPDGHIEYYSADGNKLET